MADLSATYVVIGGGIAGVSCVETLCQLIEEPDVLLISGSDLVRVTSNVEQLTQTLIKFDIKESSADELQKTTPGLKVLTGVNFTALDYQKKLIKLSDGKTVHYKKSVCICTGAKPRKLSGTENCSDFVLTLRDVESVESLEKHLKNSNRVVIVGNGGIATELVYKVRGVKEINWLVRDKHISATFVDPGAAQFFLNSGALTDTEKKLEPVVKRLRYTGASGEHSCMGAALGPDWHTKFDIKGAEGEIRPKITVEYETEVTDVLKKGQDGFPDSESEWPVAVKLNNGKILGCDLIIVATGVTPNCEIFKEILDLDSEYGGIKVDKTMRTSAPNVFAAGDIACANWPKDKHWFQMRLWTQARQMGSLAGRAMTDVQSAAMFDFSFECFAHITKFFGFKVVLLGLYNAQGMSAGSWEALVRVTPGREYIKLIISQGKVHGAVLVGETELEETFENLILNGTDVSNLGDDLLNPNVDVDDYFD